MHTIQGKSIGINDVVLDTYSRCVLKDGAQLTVEAGTNGYKGKGREAGGPTATGSSRREAGTRP